MSCNRKSDETECEWSSNNSFSKEARIITNDGFPVELITVGLEEI